ncbi:preprotein translocase subunit SecG [Pseudomonas sp. NPDC087804]|uniref:preprotein translocase subunit SecG n=1 Tax=Pseudomonas sp. NPDC087804 TaxID=3364449 RepID=UPI00381B81C6
MLETVVVVFHMLGALGVVALVLLQQGKGADAGASLGAGASNNVFGSQGSSTFLSKFTAILAAGFFITSLGLGYFAKEKAHQLTQAGLPNPAVLEVPKQQQPASDDVPVLQEQKSATPATDVPPAQEQK